MSSLSQNEQDIVTKVKEIAQFLRSEKHFTGWPGLPCSKGQKPSLEQANLFFLGSCIDWQEKTEKAWDRARHFLQNIVPQRNSKSVWKWIASHSEVEWKHKYREYGLHRLRNGHDRMYRIAKVIQSDFHGDPRRIWNSNKQTSLLTILEDHIKVGPAISRMILGALRDHRLITRRKSDFKPDIWVCRLMKAVGLTKTKSKDDVLDAGRRLFPDPWKADVCFYHLGSDHGITTKRQFESYYKKMKLWLRYRKTVGRKVMELKKSIEKFLGKEEWIVYRSSSLHWIGFDLVRKGGTLKPPMKAENASLWAWIGIGFDNQIKTGIDIGGRSIYFDRLHVKKTLKKYQFRENNHTAYPARDMKYFWIERHCSQTALNNKEQAHLVLCHSANLAKQIILSIENNVHNAM